MTTPWGFPGGSSDSDESRGREPVNLDKPPLNVPSDPAADAPFDPYRFGKPDHPVPPEYAPPGYASTGYTPVPQPSPYSEQQLPPPPYPYPGSTPPPPHYGYPPPRPGNGKATAALVLGILSIVFFWLSLLDAVFIILALIFGLLGLSDSRLRGRSGRSLAIAGLVCMGVGAAAALLWTSMLVHAVNKCGGFSADTSSTAFDQCVSDHIWWK